MTDQLERALGAEKPIRSVRMVFPLVPASAKNRTQIRRPKGGGKPWIAKSEDAEQDQQAMALMATAQARPRVGTTLFGRNYVGAEITLDPDAHKTSVIVHDLGEQPKSGRRYTQRDVHGIVESVMDALQGVVFDDDRQARWVIVRIGRVA